MTSGDDIAGGAAALAARMAITWRERVGDAIAVTLPGTLAKIDLSGFTRLSERLALGVKGGAEELSEAIDATFSRLIGPVLDRGGDVLQFGGDALVLWFEDDGHERRAAATGVDLQRLIRAHGRIETPLGAVRLKMSIGAASGEVGFAVVGITHRELVTFGPTVSTALRLEQQALAGQVLVSPATAAELPSGCLLDVAGAFRLVHRITAPLLPPAQAGGSEFALHFVPPELRPVPAQPGATDRGTGEHRTVAVAFLLLSGTDDLFETAGAVGVQVAVSHVADAIDAVVDDLGVCWSATDLSVDGVVFLLFTGAPAAKGDDDERLLRAVHQVLDATKGMPVRAGVHRGRVFSGSIGHPSRRTHAFLGDTVNLAARLMGKAEPGQAVASRVILDHSRATFASENIAPFTVKGKRDPIDAVVLGNLLIAGRSSDAARSAIVVGREPEQLALADGWRAAKQGRGRAIELVGEPGIGKSMIVADLIARCSEATVIVARCDPYETSSPYWAVRAALLRVAGEADAASFPAWVAGLGGLDGDPATLAVLAAPSFGISLPTNGSVDQLDPAVVQDRRHDAVVELLGAAVDRPMLIIAEDVHWADDASLSLLRRLAVATVNAPWLLVATARPESAALGDAAHERRVLEPLAREVLGALAAQLALDSDLLDSDVERLVERSGGNPLFLTELITAGRTDELPDTIEQLLAARIDALPPWDRALLRDAAVLGSTVELDLAAEVCEDVEVARPDRWSSLSAFVFVGETSLTFRHDLMRIAAYEGLAKRRRRVLHGRAADALAGKADDTTLAVHLLRAERWADAWPIAARAATAARAQGALADAADLYAQAAAATRRAQPAALEASFELDAEHADALELLGRFPDAEKVLRRVARSGPLAPRDRARLARQTARVQRRVGHFAAALAWATRGLAAVELLDPGRQRDLLAADLLLLRASIRRLQARPALAKPWAEAGLEIATRLDDRRLQGVAHIHLEAIAQELRLPERQLHEDEAIRLLSDAGADGLLATVLLNSAFARHESGEWAEALGRLDRAAAAFQRVGQGVDEVLSRSTAAMIMVLQGAHLQARRQLAVADRISRTLGWRQGRAYAGYGLAFLDAAAGDLTTARRGFDEAEAVFAAEGVVPFVYEVRRWRAEALLRSGAAEKSLEIVDGLIADAGRPPDPPLDLAALRLRGHALAVLGRTGEAARQVDEALYRADEVGYAYEVALALWAREGLGAHARSGDDTARRLRIFAELGITDGLTLAPCAARAAPEKESGPE